MRGGRYISAETSAKGEWKQGGSSLPGADAYATSKQCLLAAAMEFAREIPRLHINAVEPGITPGTGLATRCKYCLPFPIRPGAHVVPPFVKYRSTPERAARLLTQILLNDDGKTGMYYDEKGEPMFASTQVRSPKFTAHVVAETRAMLAAEAGFQQSGHESQRVGTGSKRSSSTEREARRM
jgi:NAD(P)-dependent dehydrogenase (short-subunit alcohol dehydrogenase family)